MGLEMTGLLCDKRKPVGPCRGGNIKAGDSVLTGDSSNNKDYICYPCYAPHLSISRNKIICIFKRESIKKQFFIVDFYTHYTDAHRLRNNS